MAETHNDKQHNAPTLRKNGQTHAKNTWRLLRAIPENFLIVIMIGIL